MKFLVFTFLLFFLAYSPQEQKIVEQNQPQTEIKPKIYQDENGWLINEDGWEIPKFEAKNKEYWGSRDLINYYGKIIKIYFYSYSPKNEVIVKSPFTSPELNEKYSPAKLFFITESKGKNQNPYCYDFTIKKKLELNNDNSNSNSHSDPMIYKVCDFNGDGIFETRPQGHGTFAVPNWVK